MTNGVKDHDQLYNLPISIYIYIYLYIYRFWGQMWDEIININPNELLRTKIKESRINKHTKN